ncbi:MAG: hypothetical protein Q7T53_02325 [Deltaproteobacteria bacterium]|nr:hypothetical protein [Deltaproteobacteria bacterium]
MNGTPSKITKVIFFISFLALIDNQCLAFDYKGLHWNNRIVSFYLWNPPSAAVIQAHNKSAATWNNAGANFYFLPESTTSNIPGVRDFKNVIGGANDPYFQENPDAAAFTRCWPTSVGSTIWSECDTVMNMNDPISTSGDPNAYDLESISVHEFGHWLRLGDLYSTGVPGNVMFWSLSLGEIRRILDIDSRNGIIHIYGPR